MGGSEPQKDVEPQKAPPLSKAVSAPVHQPVFQDMISFS